MKASDTDILKKLDLVSESPCDLMGFRGHRQVGTAGRDHEDRSLASNLRFNRSDQISFAN